ncbi:MAG: hypothetical protein ABS95_03290 [Verrucomicrobia bacterium SCN 57-15]|nr:MAG: hypothetical protein ABS95_03290 [Verrucomicrobia bacterium SCN 57-15]
MLSALRIQTWLLPEGIRPREPNSAHEDGCHLQAPGLPNGKPVQKFPPNQNRMVFPVASVCLGKAVHKEMKIEVMNKSALENISAFTPEERLVRDNGAIAPGQVCLANESRFNSAFFSEPLTAYTTGWREPNNLEAMLDFIAPPVQVGRRFEFKKADNSEAFYSEVDDTRAIGADFKRVEYKGTSVNEKTLNKGLTMRLDLDIVGDMPNWREVYTSRLLQRLMRNELRRAITVMFATVGGTPKTWDTTAGKDPDQDILTELLAAVDESGVRPNRVVFGDVAWNKRLLAHRAQASAGGYASAALTPDELAGFLGVEGVRISRERYQSSTTAKSKIVPDNVLLFYGTEGVSIEDPTNAKRFWSAAEGGNKFRVYEQQVNGKMVDLTVEHYSNILVTSTVGLRKLVIS